MSLQLPYQIVTGMEDVQANFEALANPKYTWSVPTLLNSWANTGSGLETVGYLKDALGFVHVKGVVSSGTSGTAVFVLPAGFRPGATAKFGSQDTNNAEVTITIDTSGNVKLFCTTATSIGLSSIFLAEN